MKTQTTPIQQVLRDLYADHPLMMQAANEIDRLEQEIIEKALDEAHERGYLAGIDHEAKQ